MTRGRAVCRMTSGQAAQVAGIWRRAWHSANPQVRVADLAPGDHWLERVRSEFFGPAECWVLAGAALQGFVVIEPARAYLAQLHVDPDWQGQGAGRLLIEQACERMPAGWSLHVAESNQRAQRFYGAAGMQRGESGHDPVTGRARVAWHWRPAAARAALLPLQTCPVPDTTGIAPAC